MSLKHDTVDRKWETSFWGEVAFNLFTSIRYLYCMSHNYPAKLSYLPRIVRKHQTPVAALCSDFGVGRACIQYFHCAVVSHAEKQDDGSFLFIVNIFFPLVFVSCHYPGICFVKCTG